MFRIISILLLIVVIVLYALERTNVFSLGFGPMVYIGLALASGVGIILTRTPSD